MFPIRGQPEMRLFQVSQTSECLADLNRLKKWFDSLPNDVQFPKSIVRHQETIESIDLHSFGDASGNGVAATVYAIVNQQSGSSQGLVAAKSRLAKRNTTIPRLELTSAHMATNLLNNVNNALLGFIYQLEITLRILGAVAEV